MSKFSFVLVLLSLFLLEHRIKTESSVNTKIIGKAECEADRWDEIECGSCDFQNGTTCGWKDVSGVKNGWKVVNRKYLTTPPVAQYAHFKLRRPNLPRFDHFCQMALQVDIVSVNDKTQLYVEQQIPNSKPNFLSFTNKDMNQEGLYWTKAIVPIHAHSKKISSGILSNNSETYSIEIGAKLYHAGDRITIKQIRFENCNQNRQTIGDCDFEDNNLCQWSFNEALSVMPWKVDRADQVKETYAPIEDHTLGSGSGHFAWTTIGNTKANSHLDHVAVLTSVPLDTRVCVSFWYYMDGDSYNKLYITDQIVSLNSTVSATHYHAGMTIQTGGMWQYRQADIAYRGAPFVVNIEAQVADATCVIAIDDIQMKLGECTNAPVCDFETDSCGFQLGQSQNAKSTWQRLQSKVLNKLIYNELIINDHTIGTSNGHMMLFTCNWKKMGDIIWLTSPELDSSGYSCLHFYYYISKDHAGTLKVIHRPVFSKIDEYIDGNGYFKKNQSTLLLPTRAGSWRKSALTLAPLNNQSSVYDFMVIAESGIYNGFIALDDIQLTSGKCPEPVSCDFEQDYCGWYIDQDHSSNSFERQSSAKRSRAQCIVPPNDHTYQSANGHYMFLCFENSNQELATINSDDFDGTQNWCFSFWTHFPNVTNIYVRVLVETRDGHYQIGLVNGKNLSNWTYHEYSIDGDVKYETSVLSLVVTPNTPYDGFIANQGVAFDDLKFSPNKCGYKPKVFVVLLPIDCYSLSYQCTSR